MEKELTNHALLDSYIYLLEQHEHNGIECSTIVQYRRRLNKWTITKDWGTGQLYFDLYRYRANFTTSIPTSHLPASSKSPTLGLNFEGSQPEKYHEKYEE